MDGVPTARLHNYASFLLSGRATVVFDGYAARDVEIAKAAINMSAFKPTTLIIEDTDLLVLLLYHAEVSKSGALCFRSNIASPYCCDINALRQILSEVACKDLLFAHAFTGCDSVSRIFGIGKRLVFQRIVKKENTLGRLFC